MGRPYRTDTLRKRSIVEVWQPVVHQEHRAGLATTENGQTIGCATPE